MSQLHLVIGNKNYSSWSMRPWVLMRGLGLPFTEVMLPFETPEWTNNIARLSPSKMVPVLWDGEPGESTTAVWETVAIYEFLAERFPTANVWPTDPVARAYARSIVAEMHAGFRNLRINMPMNIRASFPGYGIAPGVQKDIARIEHVWAEARTRFAGDKPFLFGDFCAADAMYAPVAMRFATYQPKLSTQTVAYVTALTNAPGVRDWIAEARQETAFVSFDEPYV